MDWNFSTKYPKSSINGNAAIIGDAGSEMLSFDDSRGISHTNKSTKVKCSISGDNGKDSNLLIASVRPLFAQKYKEIIFRHSINIKKYTFCVSFPREIPYYAFIVFKRETNASNYDLEFNVYKGSSDEVELGNLTVYRNISGPLYRYPYVSLPYTK